MPSQHSNAQKPAKSRPPGVFALLLLAVLGMIVLQRLTTNDFEAARNTNDVLRRIVMLPQSTLPDQIGEWQLTDFDAPAPENRPPNQKFLSHTWQFRRENLGCLVAFDQSNWHDWHELTECYRSAGWTLLTRKLQVIDISPDWPCIVATFSKDSLNATLAFSLCFRDGIPLLPADLTADEVVGTNWFQRIQARSKLASSQSHPDPKILAVQFQVFCVSPQPVNDASTTSLVALHEATRSQLLKKLAENSAAQTKTNQ